MRVLWLTVDRSKRALQWFDPFRIKAMEAMEREGWECVVKVRDVPNPIKPWALQAISDPSAAPPMVTRAEMAGFDFVYTDLLAAFLWEPWESCRGGMACLMADQHGDLVSTVHRTALALGIAVWYVYRDALARFWPDLPRGWWLPYGYDPEIFFPRNRWDQRRSGVLMTGQMGGGVYADRQDVHSALCHHPLYHQEPRPAETAIGETQPRGSAYAALLSSYKMSVATHSAYGYTVTKYYEIAACGTALLCNAGREMVALGFIPGVHYIPLPDRGPGFASAVREIATCTNRAHDVAAAGHELVKERHTTEKDV